MNYKQYKSKLLIFLLLLSTFGYGQSLSDWYGVELAKSLFPKKDTLHEKEVLMFIAKPSFVNPEYSIRITEKANQSFLELRILEKNLWNELFRLRRIGSSELSLQTHLFSIPISNTFKNEMINVFSKAISMNESRQKPSEPRTFDGTCYEFQIKECGNYSTIKIDYELDKSYLEFKVAETNNKIVKDIIDNTFIESKYEMYKTMQSK